MFDLSNYPDIAPAELRELMHEMDQSEPELDLEELTEWLEKQHADELQIAFESGCIFDHDHAVEPALCLAHN
jgi:hypothetical protein